MKTRLLAITICGVLLTAMAMLAYGGQSIVNSKHDMTYIINYSQDQAYHYLFINNYGEVCVYCHTPHGANANIQAPLWNRNVNSPSAYTLYNSTTMNNPPTTVSPVSLLCLSCHDGTIAVDEIINAPGSGANLSGPWYGNSPSSYHSRMGKGTAMSDPSYCGGCHTTGWGGAPDREASYLSTDLSNDHPISMTYPTSDTANYVYPITDPDVKLFDGKVECSSCHDVHNPQNTPFLRRSNAGSGLCYACHIK